MADDWRTLQVAPGTLQSLSPQLRKAARFVVNNPGEIATRSQRFVARSTDIPAPTFTRLAKAIGYKSYDELRDACRDKVLHRRTCLAEKAQVQIGAREDETGFAARHVAASLRNTDALLAELDVAQVQALVRLLEGARRVRLLGALSAKPILDYVVYLANMSLGGWRAFGPETGALANDLADLDEKDACIVFSVQPYAARAVALARYVAGLHVPVVAVTDSPAAPVADYAQHCVALRTESPQFFPSHATAVVFFEAIVGMLIRMNGQDAQQRIAEIEHRNHQLGEYWQDMPVS
ncbi:MAG: MurR/RpiR family transcriptional regulator [Pseudomonadota bacterium]